jgi:hypothetical protein
VLLGPQSTEDDLRHLLHQHAAVPNFDVDALFAAHRALKGIASDLQCALTQVEDLQFASASLVALLTHGPLKAPGSSISPVGISMEEAFGPSTAPQPPPALEFESPATAVNLVAYQHRLAALPRAFFIPRCIKLCMGDVNRYQDTKDINRDSLLVNGVAISGAHGGYDAAVTALADGLRAASSDAGGRTWHGDTEDLAAQLLLGTLNRTSSGFIAFEEVLQLLNCPDAVIVAPESAAAKPLEAVVIGGLVMGRAHTRYSVRRFDGSNAPLVMVDAVFCFRVTTSVLQRLVQGGPGNWPTEDVQAVVLLQLS